MEHLRDFTIFNSLFYVANALWLLEFVVFHNRSQKGKYEERFSFFFLVLTIGLTIAGSIFFNREGWGKLTDTPVYSVLQILAIALYGIGLFLRYFSSRVLGRYFTRHVTVESEMTFISNGPYRYLRHPLYLGLFLIIIAFPMYIGNILGLFIFGPLIFIALNYRMVLEEKALEHHHPEYRTWKKKRYRFLPFIY